MLLIIKYTLYNACEYAYGRKIICLEIHIDNIFKYFNIKNMIIFKLP